MLGWTINQLMTSKAKELSELRPSYLLGRSRRCSKQALSQLTADPDVRLTNPSLKTIRCKHNKLNKLNSKGVTTQELMVTLSVSWGFYSP